MSLTAAIFFQIRAYTFLTDSRYAREMFLLDSVLLFVVNQQFHLDPLAGLYSFRKQ